MSLLLVICAEPSATRLRSALSIALTHAALGGEARLLLDTAAVAALRLPIAGEDDADYRAGGLPGMAELVEEAFAAGIGITLCQSGVAMIGATTADFDPRAEFGGMPGAMAALGPGDRILAV